MPWAARVQAAIDVLDGRDAVKDFTAAQIAVLFDVSQAAISKHRMRRRPRKTLADRFRRLPQDFFRKPVRRTTDGGMTLH
jgi:hypothetical protein